MCYFLSPLHCCGLHYGAKEPYFYTQLVEDRGYIVVIVALHYTLLASCIVLPL